MVMHSRQLGSSGIPVSALGLGCNAFGTRVDIAGARAVVHAALEEGVTLFDTADGYGRPFGTSERMLGEVLSSVSDKYLIATKGGANPGGWDKPPNASRAWLTQALDESLARLRVERIDLYQLHFPDAATPLEETMRALSDMVSAGKVRAIGCSNFTAPQIREALQLSMRGGLARFESTQSEYHLLARTKAAEVVETVESSGMSLLPYFPLAGGLLTGKYDRGAPPAGSRFAREPNMAGKFQSEQSFRLLDALKDFAHRHDRSVPELAFGWLLAQPAVPSVIAGATTADQVRANAASVRRPLEAETVIALESLLEEHGS